MPVVDARFWRTRPARCGAARATPTDAGTVGVYFLLLLFQGSAIPSGSLNRDRNRGNSCETRRRVGSRSKGGSDAGASAEPRQGAGALRCLSIALSSFWQHYVSVTSSLLDSLFSRDPSLTPSQATRGIPVFEQRIY